MGVRLAEVISANKTVETLELWETDLLVANNAKQWGESLIQNKTLTRLDSTLAHGIISELKLATKDRTPMLVFS